MDTSCMIGVDFVTMIDFPTVTLARVMALEYPREHLSLFEFAQALNQLRDDKSHLNFNALNTSQK